MGEQTRNILGIAGYLKEAGTDASRVVSASIFVTDMSKKKEMDAAWTEFFGDTADARNGRCRRSRCRRPDRGGGHRAQRLSRTRSQVIARRIAADWHDGQSSASPRPQLSDLTPAVPFQEEGRRASSRTRDGMWWTRERRRAMAVAGRVEPRERFTGAQDERRLSVRQNRVVLTPVAGAKSAVANSNPTGVEEPLKSADDGDKTNSSPGRARHKP
jgi:hypothetical protein